MTHIRKAVFSVAGFGTRFLPATKAMLKEVLPIVAGIDSLIFLTGRNNRAIADQFDANNEQVNILRAKGKEDKAYMFRNIIPKVVECIFVRPISTPLTMTTLAEHQMRMVASAGSTPT